MHLFINNDVVSTFLGNNPVINIMHGVFYPPPQTGAWFAATEPPSGTSLLISFKCLES